MNGVRILSIEAGPKCSRAHEWCPVTRLGDRKQVMTPDIADAIIREALARGFTGEVAFHYYNEPTLYQAFIREVEARLPKVRYLLWTNGDALTQSFAELFDRIVVTDYGDLGTLPDHPCIGVIPCEPDQRASIYDSPVVRDRVVCFRPSFELPVDCEGRFHLCCEDWAGTVDMGSIDDIPGAFDQASVARSLLADGTDCPDVCRRCTNPLGALP